MFLKVVRFNRFILVILAVFMIVSSSQGTVTCIAKFDTSVYKKEIVEFVGPLAFSSESIPDATWEGFNMVSKGRVTSPEVEQVSLEKFYQTHNIPLANRITSRAPNEADNVIWSHSLAYKREFAHLQAYDEKGNLIATSPLLKGQATYVEGAIDLLVIFLQDLVAKGYSEIATITMTHTHPDHISPKNEMMFSNQDHNANESLAILLAVNPIKGIKVKSFEAFLLHADYKKKGFFSYEYSRSEYRKMGIKVF